ncbi:MAG: dicarboxylate/amino acid:cation symporter [Clostridiales bacterium]|nr:dicarboxylate/amino acid:cation symporter [Clostridiales bacterium]
MKKKKMSDVTKILIAMVAGSAVGLIVGEPASAIGFIGDIWLNIMKMFLVCIVVCMLVKGISSMDSPEALGRIGVKFILFYVFTTLCASAIGVGMTLLLKPGVGFTYEAADVSNVTINEMPSIAQFFKSMFSTNIWKTFADADMMQVVILSCFIGVAIVLLPPEKREPVRNWFWSMTDLITSLISIALKLAPIGVFCLMASSLGQYGVGLLVTIAKILGVFYLCCILHLVVIYCMLLWGFTGINPAAFLKKAFPTFATAVSTCSSGAVIPVSMDVTTKNFECDDAVAGLGIPLGGTINKDGVAILCGVVLLFSGQAMGIPLGPQQIINLLFVTIMVTSAGSGVPGGGLMNLMIVATAIGMPLDIIMMVGGFYRLFDMGTTSMNCLGDVSATIIIDRLEKRRAAKLEKKGRAAA